jgi:drug/metabolite transporter (DMT)-like permease
MNLAAALKPQSKTWPFIVIFGGFAIGAGGPILIRMTQEAGMSSLAIVAGRQIISMLFLTPLVLRNHWHEIRARSRRDVLFAALAGIVMAIRFVIMFEAYNNVSILVAGVLNGSGPLWVAFMEILFLKAVFQRNIWLGLFFALLGGVLMALAGFDGGTSLGNNPLFGAGLALLAAFLFGFYLNAGRSVRHRVSFMAYLWLITSFATITAVIAMFATGTPFTGYTPEAYYWLIILTIVAQLIAHGAMNYGLGFVSATFVSITAQVSSVLSAIGAFLVFGETPTPLQIVGSVIIIIGVSIATASKVTTPDET